MVAVLAIASLAAVADVLDAGGLGRQRARRAAENLQLARIALLGYAAAYRDRHPGESFAVLPCPDLTGSGQEQTPCGRAGETAIGLLPVKTLGLPDLRDASGNCLWYAVSGPFKSNPRTSPLNWDTRSPLMIRDAAGSVLAAPEDGGGGAAAVVIAPGEALAGQRRSALGGICGADAAQAAAYVENRGDLFFNGDTAASGARVSNDRLAWMTPKEILDLVVGRRDFAAYIDEGIESMRAKLAGRRPAAGNRLPSVNPFGRQSAGYAFYADWADQFRYLRCSGPACFIDTGGGRHHAVLLFAGRAADGRPRPAGSRDLGDYFEAALPIAAGRSPGPCLTDAASFDNSGAPGRAADLALCVE